MYIYIFLLLLSFFIIIIIIIIIVIIIIIIIIFSTWHKVQVLLFSFFDIRSYKQKITVNHKKRKNSAAE